MKYLSFFLLLLTSLSLGSCDWLMQDSDKDSKDETSEVEKSDEPGDQPPGGGISDY